MAARSSATATTSTATTAPTTAPGTPAQPTPASAPAQSPTTPVEPGPTGAGTLEQPVNDGVAMTATVPTQPMENVSAPNAVELAAGFQSTNGSKTVGFYKGPEPDADKVTIRGSFDREGDTGYRATTDVYHRYTLPGTETPIHKRIVSKGKLVTLQRYNELKQADEQSR